MFDLTKTEPVVVDILQIEAEARRMRAEIIAQGLSAFGQKIARLLTSTFGATARS
ncbi:MAG: RSP_7527 family protein [Roseinatronobacter sp.]